MMLYNTLTKQISELTPLEAGKLNVFVCGPTVYDLSHLGHAKTYTQLDVLVRTLRMSGLEVFYLQNITDIDDKIITRSTEQGIGWEELRTKYEAEYYQDMETLGNNSVTQYARATDYIDDIISQVQKLLNKGYGYTIAEDGIYFEISKFADYGKLSGRQEVQENDSESRIDKSERKRGWNDFCLWKFSKPGEPIWPAQFGDGRPGWHIEDTAISEHFFGPQYDLHGGAIDLIFPHHEAEITQMESASGQVPFVGHWVHTGFLTIEDAKMSKSNGNFYTIREVLEKGYDPRAIRLFMLQSHYRSAINFSWDGLDAAQNRLARWQQLAGERWQVQQADTLPDANTSQVEYAQAALVDFKQALEQDLDTPSALAAAERIFSFVQTDGATWYLLQSFISLLQLIDRYFGITLFNDDITDVQKQLILEREKARETQNWARSDELRDQLASEGITVRDTAQRTIWTRQ